MRTILILCVLSFGCGRDWQPADSWDRMCGFSSDSAECQELCATEPERYWCDPATVAQVESCKRDAGQAVCAEAVAQAADAGLYPDR